jgi:hypothetical protein
MPEKRWKLKAKDCSEEVKGRRKDIPHNFSHILSGRYRHCSEDASYAVSFRDIVSINYRNLIKIIVRVVFGKMAISFLRVYLKVHYV